MDSIYSIIGYSASILVAVSLFMNSAFKLRLINLIGALAFSVYGIMIEAYPVSVLNILIVFADIYFLSHYIFKKEYFSIVEISHDSQYLEYFIKFFGADIAKLYPEFTYRTDEKTKVLLLVRDLVPAGIVFYENNPEGLFFIHLDYVVPRYRDMKIGRFLYRDSLGFFRNRGCREIRTPLYGKNHLRYLKKMGFRRIENEGDIFSKAI